MKGSRFFGNAKDNIGYLLGLVSVKHPCYGATGDSSNDDTAAIQAAAIASVGSTLYFPQSVGEYLITDTITIPANTNVIMDGGIVYSGNNDKAAILIGSKDVAVNGYCNFVLKIHKDTQSTWLNEMSVGIKIINSYYSDIYIKRASNFTVGCQLAGIGSGFVYNNVRLGNFFGNKVGLDLVNESIDGYVGWTNENLFLGGEFRVSNTINTDLPRYGIRITSCGPVDFYNNSNLFVKPSFELGAGNQNALPILIEHGKLNEFMACRHEDGAIHFSQTENGSYKNHFDLSTQSTATLNDIGNYPSSTLSLRDSKSIDMGTKIFDSGPIWKTACYYDGNSSIHIPGMCWIKRADGNIYDSGVATINDDNITFSLLDGGPGVFVDTTKNKRFALIMEIPENNDKIKFGVRCYATDGTILDGNSATYLKSYDSRDDSKFEWWSTHYGGLYRSRYLVDRILFCVTSEVKKVCVGLTSAGNVRGMSIYSLDGMESHTWSGYEDIVKGGNIGICAPTTGTWNTGKTIWNANIVNIDSPLGWQYVADEWRSV